MTESINGIRRENGKITKLRLASNPKGVDRDHVVNQVKGGANYITATAPGAPGEKVHAVKHSAGYFLSTDPNEKKGDNLGNLPEF